MEMEILHQDVLIFRKADTGSTLVLGHKCFMEVFEVNREVLHFLMTFAMPPAAHCYAVPVSHVLLIVLQLTVSAILTMQSSIVPWVDVGSSSSRSVFQMVPRSGM